MPLAHMFWRLFGRLAALLALTVAGPSAMAAEPALVLSGRVVDDASLLDGSARAALTDKLAALEARTGIQFVVATTPSLGGQPIERYSLDLANAWAVTAMTGWCCWWRPMSTACASRWARGLKQS